MKSKSGTISPPWMAFEPHLAQTATVVSSVTGLPSGVVSWSRDRLTAEALASPARKMTVGRAVSDIHVNPSRIDAYAAEVRQGPCSNHFLDDRIKRLDVGLGARNRANVGGGALNVLAVLGHASGF
jgi:hypothetical protein